MTVCSGAEVPQHAFMQTMVDCYEGVHYVARFQRQGPVLHWKVQLFRDVGDPGMQITGEIMTPPNGEDEELVRMEVEDLIPLTELG
jgi:hypothetical protein